MKVRLEFKPQDLWIGVYWKKTNRKVYIDRWTWTWELNIWICVIPTVPIHILICENKRDEYTL
jgi:hypothetical protein